MGESGAALAVAGLVWLAVLGSGSAAQSACARDEVLAARCEALALQQPTQWLFDQPLNLNRAASSSLEVLPGIGPVRAAAIVAERCRARFERVEDIERVRGIGPKLRARLAVRVTVGGGPTPSCPNVAPSASRPEPVD